VYLIEMVYPLILLDTGVFADVPGKVSDGGVRVYPCTATAATRAADRFLCHRLTLVASSYFRDASSGAVSRGGERQLRSFTLASMDPSSVSYQALKLSGSEKIQLLQWLPSCIGDGRGILCSMCAEVRLQPL
jgi:hypothetical protein